MRCRPGHSPASLRTSGRHGVVFVESGQLWRANSWPKVILVAVNAVKMARTFIGWRTWRIFLPVGPRKMECSHGRRVFFVTTVAERACGPPSGLLASTRLFKRQVAVGTPGEKRSYEKNGTL